MPVTPPTIYIPADPTRNIVMDTTGMLWQSWRMPSGGELMVPLGQSRLGYNHSYPALNLDKLQQGDVSVSALPALVPPSVAHVQVIEPGSPIVETEIFPYTEEETQSQSPLEGQGVAHSDQD